MGVSVHGKSSATVVTRSSSTPRNRVGTKDVADHARVYTSLAANSACASEDCYDRSERQAAGESQVGVPSYRVSPRETW